MYYKQAAILPQQPIKIETMTTTKDTLLKNFSHTRKVLHNLIQDSLTSGSPDTDLIEIFREARKDLLKKIDILLGLGSNFEEHAISADNYTKAIENGFYEEQESITTNIKIVTYFKPCLNRVTLLVTIE